MERIDKGERFIRLANKRVNKAIRSLQMIQNLTNKRNYSFSDDQANKIIKALQSELNNIKRSFKNNDKFGTNDFTL